MGKQLRAGDRIPEFCYDTPYEPQKSFYELLNQDRPVLMVFLRNFGHPITRHYIVQYVQTIHQLHSVQLVCVVRTLPQKISKAMPFGTLPFEIICDAEGVLYDYFAIPECTSKIKSYSLEALKIIKQAQKEGYEPSKNERHQLPLTLIVGKKGQVQFAHYGRSVTDLPMDCEAMQKVAEQMQLHMPKEESAQWLENIEIAAADKDVEENAFTLPQEEISQAELLETLLDNQQQERAEQTGWTKASESTVFAPKEQSVVAVKEEISFDGGQQLAGKLICDRERIPKKVDLSALGFFGEEQE